MKCFECKKNVKEAHQVYYLAMLLNGEPCAEKSRDVCDDCYKRLSFNLLHYVEVSNLTERSLNKA